MHLRLGPLLGLGVEEVVAPEALHHLGLVDAELLRVLDGELTDGEGPAVQTGAEGDGSLVWIDLDIAERLVEVGGDDDVDGLNGPREGLVEILLLDLKFEQSTVDLVDDDDGLDTLTQSLSQNSLRLHAHAFDTVHHDESAVGNSQGGGNLGREVDVTGRIDQVDQELVADGLLWDVLQIFLVGQMGVQRDRGRFDGDTSVLLVLTGVCESAADSRSVWDDENVLRFDLRFTGLRGRDDAGALDEGVGQGGLAVVDVGDHAHVPDLKARR